MNKDDITTIRDEIISAALVHVPFDGWRWAGVERAAIEAGHDPEIARAVFPGRMIDVLDAFADLADRKMLTALAEVDPEDLRIRDRIRQGVVSRFEYLQPHKDAVRQSASFWIVPSRKPRAAKIVWRTADHIWRWAGDVSEDYNHYTKRSLLCGILVSTTLAWLNDAGENMESTKSFLDRRIENVMQLNKMIGKIKKTS